MSAAGLFPASWQNVAWRHAAAVSPTAVIAYELNPPGPNHIYTATVNGQDQTLVVKGRDPAWSPDGERLSYRTGNPQKGGGLATGIHIVRADGTQPVTYEPNVAGEASGEAGPIVWSRDGRWLAFDTLGGIYLMHPNGRGLRLVSRFPGHRLACYDLEPSWRPNGNELVFAVICDGGNLGIWKIGFDGRRRHSVVSTSSPLVAAYQPAWSPDGHRIVFVGVRHKRGGGYAYDLYSVRPNGRRLTRLTSGSDYPNDPAWSPDGTRISFSVYGKGVFLMRRDGSGVEQLDFGSGDACCLAWDSAGG